MVQSQPYCLSDALCRATRLSRRAGCHASVWSFNALHVNKDQRKRLSLLRYSTPLGYSLSPLFALNIVGAAVPETAQLAGAGELEFCTLLRLGQIVFKPASRLAMIRSSGLTLIPCSAGSPIPWRSESLRVCDPASLPATL